MSFEGVSLELFLKALFRILPSFLLIRTPEEIKVPFTARVFLSFTLSLILSERLIQEGVPASLYHFDLFLGTAVGVIIALFFSASMQFSFFLKKDFDGSLSDTWKLLLDSFSFIVLLLFLIHLRLERSLLNLLVSVKVDQSFFNKFISADFWSRFMSDVSVLALKVSGFGLVFVLSKRFFEEIYLRIGGEAMRIVFSLSFFMLLLIVSPLLLPSLGHRLSEILSSFWKTWMGF
jgi:hypothetical protein